MYSPSNASMAWRLYMPGKGVSPCIKTDASLSDWRGRTRGWPQARDQKVDPKAGAETTQFTCFCSHLGHRLRHDFERLLKI